MKLKTLWLLPAAVLLTVPALAQGDKEHTEKMAKEHAGETPVATPATAETSAVELDTQEVAYATTADGRDVKGFLARPKGAAGAPGLVVIHEWWGLNDNVRAMARKLAALGYAALAVDLYGGQKAEDSEGARALMQAALANPGVVEENLRQAYKYLESRGAKKIGSIGWCFGGGWSLRTALLFPKDLDAAVIYYGRVVTEPEQLAPLEVPILGLFGALDKGIPVEGVRAFESALKGLGKKAEIHVYEGADHAFANPSGTRYNAAAAEDAWAKTVAFFAANLQG